MSNVSEAASWVMWHLVTHDGDGGHGYSQPNRNGNGTTETINVPNWGNVVIHGGDYDCSSACIGVYEDLGIDVGGATYTGNELQDMTSTGNFTAYRAGSIAPKDGDILLRYGHTEMVVNNATEQAGFRRSEYHTANGRTGDQDGQESAHSPLNIGAWTYIIRYTGPDKTGPGATAQPAQSHPARQASQYADCTGLQRIVGAVPDNVWGPDTGKRVGAVQMASNYHGVKFPYGVAFTQRVVGATPDGIWGRNSRACHDAKVREIQRYFGIAVDGILGADTDAHIHSLHMRSYHTV